MARRLSVEVLQSLVIALQETAVNDLFLLGSTQVLQCSLSGALSYLTVPAKILTFVCGNIQDP
jgi:hypothetical protein